MTLYECSYSVYFTRTCVVHSLYYISKPIPKTNTKEPVFSIPQNWTENQVVSIKNDRVCREIRRVCQVSKAQLLTSENNRILTKPICQSQFQKCVAACSKWGRCVVVLLGCIPSPFGLWRCLQHVFMARY